jgi:P4 family phage/plasmid primase-like protien
MNPVSVPVADASASPVLSHSASSDHLSPFQYMLKTYKLKKDDTRESTNTRIGDPAFNIYGGSYHVPDEEYPTFLKRYFEEIVAKNLPEYLTEKQLPEKGPILVDIDLRFPYECSERKYTREHIGDLLELYLSVLSEIYQFDEDSSFQVYLFEKYDVNRIQNKNLTKDGIHLIIGIHCERPTQILLRQMVMERIQEVWSDLAKGGELGQTNAWEDVFDDGISTGVNNWQLYGSSKPNHASYKLTYIYKVDYCVEEEEGGLVCHSQNAKNNIHVIRDHFQKMSARYNKHPCFFYRSPFLTKLNNYKEQAEKRNTTLNQNHYQIRSTDVYNKNMDLLDIRTREDLDAMLQQFLDNIPSSEYIQLRETYEYVMTLPSSFYENGSYNRWIGVGWALRNTDDRLFIVWLAFSAQSSTFDFSSISDLYDRWLKFDLKNSDGLTKRSIMHWSKEHARAKYNQVRLNSVDYKIDQCLGKIEDFGNGKKRDKHGCGDFDIAEVLYHLKKGEYVCVSVKSSVWYKFEEPRWVEIDSGTTLRKSISTELRNIYTNKATKLMEDRSKLNETEHADRIKILTVYIDKLLEISQRLANTNDKKNIMTEAKELFYDSEFLEKIDNNPYLLCFTNGVVDFKQKVFRRGVPEDYLTKCTNIEYRALDYVRDGPKIAEIKLFMQQLFPITQLCEYMWAHLASTLIGIAGDQTFHMYIGQGQNGKSVLVDLMGMVLGNYKCDVPLSVLTDRRTKVGGLAPEVVAMKGARFAVMNEPQGEDRINEGVMKQLTSGVDPIQARAPYMTNMLTFIPQFKLAMCSNAFMEIRAQDHGTWRRIRVVDFMSLFTDEPVANDPNKPYQFKLDTSVKDEKIPLWKEVFAALLVEKAFQTDGKLPACDIVKASSQSYRQRQDVIAEFIADKITEDKTGIITKTELKLEFSRWYENTYGKGGPKQKNVHEYMDKLYAKCPTRKVWMGVRIRYETDYVQEPAEQSQELDERDIVHVSPTDF